MIRPTAARLCGVFSALIVGGLAMPGPAHPQDGSAIVGKITDREGTAARKGLGEPRWTAADERTPVLPGDWLKVGARGANALAVDLGGATLILGPGALVEVVDAARVRLHAGEVELTPREKGKLTVEGPQRQGTRELTARSVLRAKPGAAAEVLAQDPRWLTGYKEKSPTEAVGALLATVDGRNVPLTLGYHKVVVDVRDQVARTEIEERFVNHTSSVLEGVFYFPLPADASISGFSMWIGDEQVHGEIVEKQRARAIYETILREKRDPGLLEWAGGNLFKARVYPIGAEKRIKISYTQVLPQTRRADGKGEFVYHHALQSELLRLTPLEELAVSITVSSARPIVDVTCPSHAARVQKTPHAAKVELEAQEYSPDRDLEVRVVTDVGADAATAALAFLPHRRADDGYFLLLVDGPVAPANPAVPAEPLDLLILADTSGSLAGPARKAQVELIAALLEGLGPQDTVDLATCDTEVRWVFDEATVATAESRERALGHLESRRPLGWTDLDRAIAAAADRAGPRTQVVYVGDGAVTTGDADASGFARRAPSLYEGKGTFHAIVPGTTSEPPALRAIAALGGGTVRALGGGSDPSALAFAFLAEVVAPRVKGLKLAFEGLEVAAVYPDVLPDLPAGAQQVVVGRWNPTAAPAPGAKGRVRLTGALGGKPIDVATEVTLGGAATEDEAAASFIPRLWARAHLDHLLMLGSDEEVQQRVIALSEDFQLITPYTSFLVLESDADRERFQVKKRLRMRDGEEFFAKGREDATHELTRQAVLAAKRWRRELRARTLEQLADMNRGLVRQLGGAAYGGFEDGYALDARAVEFAGRSGYAMRQRESLAMDAPATSTPMPAGGEGDELADRDDAAAPAEAEEESKDAEAEANEPAPEAPPAPPAQPMEALERRAKADDRFEAAAGRTNRGPGRSQQQSARGGGGLFLKTVSSSAAPGSPFDGLLPGLPRAWSPAWSWPGDQAAFDALAPADLRTRVGRVKEGGLRIRTQVQRAGRRGRLEDAGEGLWLLAADRWATAPVHREGEDVRLDWLEGGQRGALTAAWLLGRTRPGEAGDVAAWASPWSFSKLEDFSAFSAWTTTSRRHESGDHLLTFTQPGTAVHVDVLVSQGAVTRVRWGEGEGEVVISFEGFVEVAGARWPTKVVRTAADGKQVEVTTVAVESLAPAPFQAALAETLSVRQRAVLLRPTPELRAARAAIREGKAGLEDHWVVLGAHAATQRWQAARPALDAVLEATKGKPGRDAILATALLHSRRHEELRVHVEALARALETAPRPAEVGVALHLLGWSGVFNDAAERLQLVMRLRAVVERHPALADARSNFDVVHAQALQSLGQLDEAVAFLRGAVARDPERYALHQQLASLLQNGGDPEGAVAAIDEALAKHGPWPADERATLARFPVQLLWSAERLDALVARVERLERDDPESAASVAELHLASLVMLDRADAAWQRVLAWSAPALEGKPLEGVALTRLQAAVNHALGRSSGMWVDRIEEDRAAHLARIGRAVADRVETFGVLQGIVGDWRFTGTVAGRAFVTELLARVRRDVATLPPDLLVRLVNLVRHGGEVAQAAPTAVWEELAEALEARWCALLAAKSEHAPTLLGLVLSMADGPRQLRVLRTIREHELEAGDPLSTRQAAATLAGAIFSQPWTAELQAEGLALVAAAAPVASATRHVIDAQRAEQVLLLHRGVDFATDARAQAVVAARPDHGELDRRRLAVARDEALREARGATLDLLAGLKLGDEVAAWIELERAWLQVKLGRDREAARETCQRLLHVTIGATTPQPRIAEQRVIAARAVATLLQLIATDAPSARDQHGAALAKLLDAGLATAEGLLDWRDAKLALLLVLDRPADLEAALRAWFGDGSSPEAVRWGLPLTFVLAERDALPAAIEVMDRLEHLDEVGAADLQRLALWLTALDRKADAQAAKVRAWALVDEWQLAQSIQQDLARVQRRGEGVPEELDPEVFVKLAALFRKAEWPQNHIWTVNNLYQTTRDFRVLESLAEGTLGHTAQSVYQLLTNVRSITDQLQEEATFDRLQAAIVGLHARPGVTAVDRRALRLLEMLVAHRAATQTQGAGPHEAAALRALREAWALGEARETGWAPGEPALYAQLLASQGAMPGAIGQEQLRQLQALVAAGKTPGERLTLTASLANVLWGANRRDEACRALAGAIDAARGPDGVLAPRHHGHLGTLSGFLCSGRGHRDAERLWLRELAFEPGHGAPTRQALRLQLHVVWQQALANDAEVSLGRGKKLYEGARDALRADLRVRANETHAYQLVCALTTLWQVASQRQLAVGDDVSRFAFGELPEVLTLYQHRQAGNLVSQVGEALRVHRDAAVALEFLVARAEAEPAWLRQQRQHAWAQHAWRLGHWRAEAAGKGKLGDVLEERLLELVQRELRRDLLAHADSPPICNRATSSEFWREKTDVFAQVAREVLAERRDVEPTIVHVARYQWHLGLLDEAIATLAAADQRKLLGWDPRALLCGWLEQRERWAEALPVAQRLVTDEPRRLEGRKHLARALFKTGQRDAAARAVKDAEAYLREVKDWSESVAYALGQLSGFVEQPAEAVRYLDEAIQLHTRSRPDRGVGGGTLSVYYRELSQAHLALGNTEAAVDAACGAVVSWGRHQVRERAADLANLGLVLEGARDLDAYVAKLDRQTDATGLENATLRRALGEVYARTQRPKQAEVQLRRSLEAQPNDPDVHRALVAVLDQLGRRDDAAEQLLALAEVSGHDAQVYKDLGDRWTQARRAADAERAYTNLVEMLPEEAESHQLLATIREAQGRLPEAVEQWRQVVRVRTDEPTGWLGLGHALVRTGEKREAAEVARKVLGASWDARFGDVHEQARQLLERAR